MRRARRLLPALFTMMLLLTVWTALFERAALGKLRGDVIAGFFYVSNWYQIWTGAGYTEANDFAPLRHLWSLAVEEQFYILWPLVMVLLLRGGSRRVAGKAVWLFGASVAVTILMAVLFYDGPIGTPEVTPDAYWNILGREISIIDTLYLSTITRAGGLLLGAAFALLWRPVAVMRGPLRDKGLRLDLKLSQEEWGDLVGTTRESINKQLRKWTEDGIVRIDDGYLVILNPVELEKLAGVILF